MSAGGHLTLVDIERRTALKQLLHRSSSLGRAGMSSEGALRSKILVDVLVATVRGAVGSRALLLTDSWCQNVGGLEVDDGRSLAHFIWSWVPI